MEATQLISDSILETDEENEEEEENKREQPLAKLCILKNAHIPEADLPLFLGDNVLGRDPNTCTLPLLAPSVSKQHATICLSVYHRRGCHSEVDIEALVWDLGSMNGTRKGRLKLTPNVRYALSDGDSLVVADIPCQYVSCAVDSSQLGPRTPVSRNSGVKSRLPDALGEKRGDKSTDSRKCVNSGTKAGVSSLKTPVRASCLSFEKTPTQPQGTLVPESDSDSDGERGGGGDRRRNALVSDSDSHKSSPTCSTFLSPTNKIVPESEDESPITPSSSTKNRPHRHVSFSKEETEVDVGGQLLEEKKALAIVHDSEEEGGREEERAAPEGKSEKSGPHLPVKQESSASLTGEDELPVSTAAVSTDSIPAFNMDSDTDMEGEEEGVASVGSVTLNTNQVNQPPNTAQFHMDSDTDVDEDEDTIDKAPKTVPSSDDKTKPPHVNSFIQPEGVTVDSDTDVDDDAGVSDAATEAKPMSFQRANTADTASLMQPKDINLDSDTDVDEEEDRENGTNKPISKIEETPTRLDIKPTGPESSPAAPHSLHLDSDTDEEAIPVPALSEPVVVSAATESCTTADGGADILSDSDTDVDDNSPLVIPVVITTLSVAPGTISEALESDSNANTDVVGSSTPPAGHTANPQDLRVDSDKDVEDQEADGGQIPSLCREKTPGLLVPLLQNCSTPVHLSEGEVEVMETQAFLSPSSVPFRGAVAPVAGPVGLSSCSDSQEDEDFLVAETQSFILQTRDCQSNPPEDHTMDPTQAFGLEPSYENDEQSSREGSFQLGLSDSSHLQCQAQAVAMESTQAFVSVDRSVNMEDTQAYAAISTAVRTSAENDLNLEATQPYGKNEVPARCSVMSDKEGQVDLALEATQVYTSECHSDSENEIDDDERKNITATAETQPFGFPTSCTPPVLHEEAAQPQQRPRGELLCTAETQPMSACDEEESDDEDSIQSPGTRTAKPLQLEEQTQPLISSDLSIVETQHMHIGFAETQPMATSENEDTDDGDSIPIFRGRRAKPRQLEEEAQPLSGSEISVTETQPMHIGGAETQPMGACEGEQSDEEDSILVPRKRKARALQLEEEQTQPLTISEVSTVETQPLETQTGVQPQRRRGRQSEAGTSGVNVRNKRGTMAALREEEEQAACSEPPKRRTRGKNKALTTTRGKRGKSNLDEDESEEEEEGEQARRARGKKSMRQQKHFEEEGEQCETEGSERAENSSPNKEKQEEGSGEDGDVANLTHHKSEKMERKEKEEQDRLLAENTARIRLEQERAEKERKEQEEKERYGRLQKEKEKKLEKERKECEEIERLEHEKAEREEKEKLEREERIEKERKEQEEKERLEKVKKELEERLERERKEQEHQARLEREAKEKEERERLEREAKEERERLEREAKEKEERERLEREAKEERERLEREAKEERERLEREAKEKEERERLEMEAKERLEKEKETKEKQIKEQQGNKDEVNSRVPTRGRRAATRTMAARSTTEPEQDSTILTNDDVPARRTRSRSNSSNSVSSERSAASVNTQEGRGRGRGRGKKRTSEPPQVTIARGNSRRRTVAAGSTEQGNNDAFPQGVLSRSNSTNSLNSDISSYSVTSQNRGRGSRQQERQRKTEPGPDSIPPVNSQSDQNSAPKPAARGRKSRKTEGSSNVAPQENDQEKADSQQASTTRGQRRANANVSDSTAADEEDQPNQKEGVGSEESPLPKRNARGRGQKAVKSETAEAPVAPAVGNVGETKDKRKGRKRELQENTEGDSSSSSKISKGKEKYQTTEATEEEGKDESKEENPVQAKRRGRASSAQAKKNAKESPLGVEVKEESEEMEKDIVEKRGRGRPSAAQKKKKEEHDESGTSVSSMTRDAKVEAPEPQTPTTSASRKRQAPANSSPVAKTPRSSTASPAASGRQQAASQAYKVLFTGVVDETGERVLARLRGSIAKGVADMNCLVTDKVRRTVKFLCAVAKGIPIVTTHWLEKSGKVGSFLSPNAYVVKDPEQEKKFGFRLQESLRIASSQPLLQGYEIHVTKSVKPEPVQMKDIISCSGATFLPKMPSSPKPQTVVISCEEDWSLCGPAVAASLPVVTAEFILTGILQQKVDFQSHTLPAPVTNLQLTGGKGRGRKKT